MADRYASGFYSPERQNPDNPDTTHTHAGRRTRVNALPPLAQSSTTTGSSYELFAPSRIGTATRARAGLAARSRAGNLKFQNRRSANICHSKRATRSAIVLSRENQVILEAAQKVL